MSCLVQFCRKDCPTLPSNAYVIRGSDASICPICKRTVGQHDTFAYPTGMRHVYKTCDGKYIHT